MATELQALAPEGCDVAGCLETLRAVVSKRHPKENMEANAQLDNVRLLRAAEIVGARSAMSGDQCGALRTSASLLVGTVRSEEDLMPSMGIAGQLCVHQRGGPPLPCWLESRRADPAMSGSFVLLEGWAWVQGPKGSWHLEAREAIALWSPAEERDTTQGALPSAAPAPAPLSVADVQRKLDSAWRYFARVRATLTMVSCLFTGPSSTADPVPKKRRSAAVDESECYFFFELSDPSPAPGAGPGPSVGGCSEVAPGAAALSTLCVCAGAAARDMWAWMVACVGREVDVANLEQTQFMPDDPHISSFMLAFVYGHRRSRLRLSQPTSTAVAPTGATAELVPHLEKQVHGRACEAKLPPATLPRRVRCAGEVWSYEGTITGVACALSAVVCLDESTVLLMGAQASIPPWVRVGAAIAVHNVHVLIDDCSGTVVALACCPRSSLLLIARAPLPSHVAIAHRGWFVHAGAARPASDALETTSTTAPSPMDVCALLGEAVRWDERLFGCHGAGDESPPSVRGAVPAVTMPSAQAVSVALASLKCWQTGWPDDPALDPLVALVAHAAKRCAVLRRGGAQVPRVIAVSDMLSCEVVREAMASSARLGRAVRVALPKDVALAGVVRLGAGDQCHYLELADATAAVRLLLCGSLAKHARFRPVRLQDLGWVCLDGGKVWCWREFLVAVDGLTYRRGPILVCKVGGGAGPALATPPGPHELLAQHTGMAPTMPSVDDALPRAPDAGAAAPLLSGVRLGPSALRGERLDKGAGTPRRWLVTAKSLDKSRVTLTLLPRPSGEDARPITVTPAGASVGWWSVLQPGTAYVLAGLDGAGSAPNLVGVAQAPPDSLGAPKCYRVRDLDDLTLGACTLSLECVIISRQVKRDFSPGGRCQSGHGGDDRSQQQDVTSCLLAAEPDGGAVVPIWAKASGRAMAPFVPAHVRVRLHGVVRSVVGGAGASELHSQRFSYRLTQSSSVEVVDVNPQVALSGGEPALLGDLHSAIIAARPYVLRPRVIACKHLEVAWLCAGCGGEVRSGQCAGPTCAAAGTAAALSMCAEVSVDDGSGTAMARAHDPAVAIALLNLSSRQAAKLVGLARQRGPLVLSHGAAKGGSRTGGRTGEPTTAQPWGLQLAVESEGRLSGEEVADVVAALAGVARDVALLVRRAAGSPTSASNRVNTHAARILTTGASTVDATARHTWVQMTFKPMLRVDVLHVEEASPSAAAFALLSRLAESDAVHGLRADNPSALAHEKTDAHLAVGEPRGDHARARARLAEAEALPAATTGGAPHELPYS